MRFDINPYVGIGPITFALLRAEVRERLAAPVELFMKGPTSISPTDAFDSLGIHVHYDFQDRCEAVELWRSDPTFRGRQLLKLPFTVIKSWLREIDHDLRADSSGLTSLTFGFGLYAPLAVDDDQSLVESVIVFRRGYYDQ